jgi:hypothetical protein
MRCGEPVAAVEPIAAQGNRRKVPAVGVSGSGGGVSQEKAVDPDPGRRDLDPISRKGREDLQDRRGAAGAGAGRQVGARAAEPGDGKRQAGGDEPAAGRRQRHKAIKAAGERGGEVHAHKPAAHSAAEIGRRKEGKRREKNPGGAADPLTKGKRGGRLHRKWRTRRTALVKA